MSRMSGLGSKRGPTAKGIILGPDRTVVKKSRKKVKVEAYEADEKPKKKKKRGKKGEKE